MKLRIGVPVLILAIALILTHSLTALACFLAAFLHELGHIFAARLFKIGFREMRLTPFGASLIPRVDMGSFLSEMIICAAGPAVNFLSAALSLLIFTKASIFGELFVLSSLFLGTLNLLPVTDFDGGRILFAFIESKFGFLCAKSFLGVTSFTIILTLWTVSLYFLLKATASLSLFIFSCSLFVKLFVAKSG